MQNKSNNIFKYIFPAIILYLPVLLFAAPADDYVITVQTNKNGITSSTQFRIPVVETEGYGYNVDCNNDGIDEETNITTANYPNGYDCNYTSAGIYTIRVKDNNGNKKGFRRIRFYNNGQSGDALKLLRIEQWGTAVWSSMEDAYHNAKNLEINATDAPNLSKTSSLNAMFMNAVKVDPDVSVWDTSNIKDMTNLFRNAKQADPDVSNWNTAKVTKMQGVFRDAISADPDVSNWDTSKVTTMLQMFRGATIADPDVSGWNTSKVKNMAQMFYHATTADPDVSGWNTAKVTTMKGMFQGATAANPDVSSWNISKVKNMADMFSGATAANPDVSNWNTAKVTNMQGMFRGATSANPDVSGWNTAKVKNISYMFYNATVADPDVSNWNTKKVANSAYTFYGATAANPDVTRWNTKKDSNLSHMFDGTTHFDRSLEDWDVRNVLDATDLFRNTSISVPHYDALLISWSQQSLKNDVPLSSDAQYCQGDDARNSLINDSNWTVSDNGSSCVPCAGVSLPLRAMHWRIVSFPCDTGSNGVEALLGGALGTYGNNGEWVMYAQVNSTGANSIDMHLLAATDTVSPGKGYWVITATDRTMEINTSLSNLSFTTDEDSANYGVDGSTRSPSFSRVVREDLPATSSTRVQNWLIGNPYTLKMSVSNLFFSHDTSPNGTYRAWKSGANNPYRDATLYAHDSSDTSATGYEAKTAGTPGLTTRIIPMEGVFIKLHKNGDTKNNYVLLPHEK